MLCVIRKANSLFSLCPYSKACSFTLSTDMIMSPSMTSPVSGLKSSSFSSERKEKSPGVSYESIGKDNTSVGLSICLYSLLMACIPSLSVSVKLTSASYGKLACSSAAETTVSARQYSKLKLHSTSFSIKKLIYCSSSAFLHSLQSAYFHNHHKP